MSDMKLKIAKLIVKVTNEQEKEKSNNADAHFFVEDDVMARKFVEEKYGN